MRKVDCVLLAMVAAAFIGLCGVWSTSRAHAAPDEGAYAGAEKCAMCHGDLTKGWKTTRHAAAFETLKKKSQDKLPACVKCHVTGFEKTGGYVDQELTPELAGVQCEACHGPAAAHAANPANKSNLVARPGDAICRECHTKGQDPKFDYDNKKRLVHGAGRK